MNINYNGGFIKNIIDAVTSDNIEDIIEDSIKLLEIALIDSTKEEEAITKANTDKTETFRFNIGTTF